MISVVGKPVTWTALRGIKPERPANAGARWHPVAHGDLVQALRGRAEERGWRVADAVYTTARGGADMAGALMLEGGPKHLGAAVSGIQFAIGFMHSNARRKALRIAVGGRVVCCCNGLCTGDVVLRHMHDGTMHIDSIAANALAVWEAEIARVPDMVRTMRETPISDDRAAAILLETGRRGLVGWGAVGRVDREYHNPTFAEHGRGTAWALLNAFTYAARANIAPARQPDAFNQFRMMLAAPTN